MNQFFSIVIKTAFTRKKKVIKPKSLIKSFLIKAEKAI